ncbi:MAG TPA: peptidylprolyl isomerase [Thermoanaerobaculia bacterium]|nr:peptidylprolyl isomerase [Thermoanaerobaculia bacterium]
MKKAITLIALALAAPAVFAQSQPAAAAPAATTTATAKDADPVIITAGSVTIRKSEFEAAVKTLPAEYQNMLSQPEGRKQFGDDFLRMRLLASEGTKAGLQNDPEVLNQLNLMRENLVASAELKKIDSGITVSDAEIQKAYAENAKQYEQVKARHILIAPKGSPAAQAGKDLTDEQAKAKAEDLRKQILAGGNFEELAKKESDDTGSGARGGDLGSFGHGQMVPEFEQAAFSAKVGEVTPVVKTQFGYHIIKVEAHDNTPLEQVRPTIEKNLKQTKLHAALDAIKDNAHATFDEAYFAPPPPPPAAVAPAATPATPAAPKSDAKKTSTKKQ